jgi:hypothetical protein
MNNAIRVDLMPSMPIFKETIAGRSRMALKHLACEVMDKIEIWCREFCQGEWKVSDTHFCVFFLEPRDAMLFKLVHR